MKRQGPIRGVVPSKPFRLERVVGAPLSLAESAVVIHKSIQIDGPLSLLVFHQLDALLQLFQLFDWRRFPFNVAVQERGAIGVDADVAPPPARRPRPAPTRHCDRPAG